MDDLPLKAVDRGQRFDSTTEEETMKAIAIALCAMFCACASYVIPGGEDANPVDSASEASPADASPAADVAAADVADATPVDASDAASTATLTVTIPGTNSQFGGLTLAGNEGWQTGYEAHLDSNQPTVVDNIPIQLDQDGACISQVGIFHAGHMLGSNTTLTGVLNGQRDVVLTEPITVVPGTSQAFHVLYRTQSVEARSSTGNAPGRCYSGTRINVSPALVAHDGNFRPYAIHAHTLAGSLPVTAIHQPSEPLLGPNVYVHRIYPTITRRNVSSTTLVNGVRQALFSFRALTNGASFGMRCFALNAALVGSFRVVDPGLTLDGVDLPDATVNVHIVDASGVVHTAIDTDGLIVRVCTVDERILSTPAGDDITLTGIPSGVASGDSLTLTFVQETPPPSTPWLHVTGAPIGDGFSLPGVPFPSLLWSDLGEVPHTLSSPDWSDGVYVTRRPNFTDPGQTLSRP